MATDQERTKQIGILGCPHCDGQAILYAGDVLFYKCDDCGVEFTTSTIDTINYVVDVTYNYLINKETGEHLPDTSIGNSDVE